MWLQDLIDTTADDYRDDYDPVREVVGLDMYIFPPSSDVFNSLTCVEEPVAVAFTRSLAAPSVRDGNSSLRVSKLYAMKKKKIDRLINADIDEKNLEWARRNVSQNGLESRINIVKTEQSGPLIPLTQLGLER